MRKHYSKEQLPIDKGWDRMQALLDSAMPTQPRSDLRRRHRFVFLLILLALGFGGSYWLFAPDSTISSPSSKFSRPTPDVRLLPATVKGLYPSNAPKPTPIKARRAKASQPSRPMASATNKRYHHRLDQRMISLPTGELEVSNIVKRPNPDVLSKRSTGENLQRTQVAIRRLVEPIALLPGFHCKVKSMVKTYRGIRPPLAGIVAISTSRHPHEIALLTGFSNFKRRGWALGLDYIHRINERLAWTTGIELIAAKVRDAVVQDDLIDHRNVPDINVIPNPSYNGFGSNTPSSNVLYEKTTVAKTIALSEDFKLGLKYSWTPKTDISINGVLSFYQAKTNYSEDFRAVHEDNTPPSPSFNSNNNRKTATNFSVLYSKYDRQDLNLLIGLETGITHRIYKNLSVFLQNRWLFPTYHSGKNNDFNTYFIPKEKYKFSSFTTHKPDWFSATAGIIYSFKI